MSRGVFIAGSGKDAGKTTLCLGLAASLNSRVEGGVSFFKPLGQKVTVVNGDSVGQDSWFISRALGLPLHSETGTPVLASRGAAERFVLTGEPEGMQNAVKRAYRQLRGESGLVLVEGTGHPGVGSVFELGNAKVASILGTPVILVLEGGVGSTIDSFCMCRAVFEAHGVPLLGVVINRVIPSRMEKVSRVVLEWFGSRGIPVFGILPFEEVIARPSVAAITRELGASLLHGQAGVRGGAGFIAAFDSTEEVLARLRAAPEKALLVSSGRPDVLDAVIVSVVAGGPCPAAAVVCGGEPDGRRGAACAAAGIPLYHTGAGLEGSALRLSRSLFKTEPDEKEKISSILEMVKEHVDPEAILNALEVHGGPSRAVQRRGLVGFLRRLFRRG